jgi:hypothetical protein
MKSNSLKSILSTLTASCISNKLSICSNLTNNKNINSKKENKMSNAPKKTNIIKLK